MGAFFSLPAAGAMFFFSAWLLMIFGGRPLSVPSSVEGSLRIFGAIASAPNFADADLSSLTSAFTGGAPVPVPLLQAWVPALAVDYPCMREA